MKLITNHYPTNEQSLPHFYFPHKTSNSLKAIHDSRTALTALYTVQSKPTDFKSANTNTAICFTSQRK